MHPIDVKKSLSSMVILADTREHPGERAKKRYLQMKVPVKRCKLDFGDYSAECKLPNGEVFSLSDSVVVERKMNLDETAACFTRERPRFAREFERARQAGAKTYLLIENGSIDDAYAGKYRSMVNSTAFTASMFAWLARYDCQILFCSEHTSGRLIHDVLYRELKERLEAMEDAAE